MTIEALPEGMTNYHRLVKLETSDRWLDASMIGPVDADQDETTLIAIEGIVNAFAGDWMLADGDVLTFDVIAGHECSSKVKVSLNVSFNVNIVD